MNKTESPSIKDDPIINHLRNVKLMQAIYGGKKLYVECMPTDEGAMTFPNSNQAVKEIELPDFKIYEEEKFGYKWVPAESPSPSLTLGLLISAAIGIEMNLDESKKEITSDVWDQLSKDNFCPNSIPIHYMKRLILKLRIPFWMAAEAIKYSFSTYAINNPIPLQGDQKRHLWENEESITKYIVRLQELINESSPSLQGAAEAYVNALTSLSETQKPPLIMAFVAGWNAREAQQGWSHELVQELESIANDLAMVTKDEGFMYVQQALKTASHTIDKLRSLPQATLLTREVFDKIWEAATNWAYEVETNHYPDQETFWKSLNI